MLVLLEIVLVAVVVFAVAAFAVGGVGAMTDAPPDRADDGLPPGPLRAPDVDRARFSLAFRGYRMSEVDAVLDRLRDELASCQDELAARRDAGTGAPEEGSQPGTPEAGRPDAKSAATADAGEPATRLLDAGDG